MTRLTCNVTAEVKEGIGDFGVTLSRLRGNLAMAYRALLNLAFDNPDAPPEWFSGAEDQICTLEATPDEITALGVYQLHHRLRDQRKAFKSALLRGYSIYRAGNGLTGTGSGSSETPVKG